MRRSAQYSFGRPIENARPKASEPYAFCTAALFWVSEVTTFDCGECLPGQWSWAFRSFVTRPRRSSLQRASATLFYLPRPRRSTSAVADGRHQPSECAFGLHRPARSRTRGPFTQEFREVARRCRHILRDPMMVRIRVPSPRRNIP